MNITTANIAIITFINTIITISMTTWNTTMRNSIISIIENNTLRSSLMLKGFLRVKKFSWEQCARETFKVYKQVCE